MAKKETQQRVLVIKNFKNIGVSKMDTEDEYGFSDKPEELILNTSYMGDHHGGLVTITIEKMTILPVKHMLDFLKMGKKDLLNQES